MKFIIIAFTILISLSVSFLFEPKKLVAGDRCFASKKHGLKFDEEGCPPGTKCLELKKGNDSIFTCQKLVPYPIKEGDKCVLSVKTGLQSEDPCPKGTKCLPLKEGMTEKICKKETVFLQEGDRCFLTPIGGPQREEKCPPGTKCLPLHEGDIGGTVCKKVPLKKGDICLSVGTGVIRREDDCPPGTQCLIAQVGSIVMICKIPELKEGDECFNPSPKGLKAQKNCPAGTECVANPLIPGVKICKKAPLSPPIISKPRILKEGELCDIYTGASCQEGTKCVIDKAKGIMLCKKHK